MRTSITSALLRPAIVLAPLCAALPAAAGTLPAGEYRIELQVDGRSRGYLVHVPLQSAADRDGAEVALWKLTGAGHGWPGGAPMREGPAGPATTVIDANAEIWRFFSHFSLPRR